MVRTTDDVKLTVALTALDPAEHTIPSTITGPHAKDVDASKSPSYAKVVAPILATNCARRFRPGPDARPGSFRHSSRQSR